MSNPRHRLNDVLYAVAAIILSFIFLVVALLTPDVPGWLRALLIAGAVAGVLGAIEMLQKR